MKSIQFFILIFYGFSIFAQSDSLLPVNVLGTDDILTPEIKKEIEILSASRTAKKLADLPVTTYVITREEILLNGYTSLVDVLKSLPGIIVSQPGSGEFGQMFSMRGLVGNQYTKILINDVPVCPSVVSGMPIEAQLPVRQAERIEVIFGPASAVYGADATAGVINIITKKADRAIFSEADIILGGNGYSYVNFMAGGKTGRNKNILKYSFYGSKMSFTDMNIFNNPKLYSPLTTLEQYGDSIQLGGITYRPTELTEEIFAQYGITVEDLNRYSYNGTLTMPEIKNISSGSHLMGLELKYRNFSFTYQNMSRQTHSSIGRGSYFYKYNNPQNFISDKINKFYLKYEKSWGRVSSSSSLSVLNYRFDNNSNFGVTYNITSDKLYFFTASDDILFEQIVTYSHKNFEIVSGASTQFSINLPNTNYYEEPFNIDEDYFEFFTPKSDSIFNNFGINPFIFIDISAFLQGYYVHNNLTLMAGIRGNGNSEYGESFNPRLAFLYKLGKKGSVRASIGTAFKAPAGDIKYKSIATLVGAGLDSIFYAVLPNPDLKPEIFRSAEFGLRYNIFKRIDADLSFYYNETENIISNSIVNPREFGYPDAYNDGDDPARMSVNSGAVAKLYGAQFLFMFNNIIKVINLNAELGFTFAKGEEILPNSDTIDYLRQMPKRTTKLKISFKPTKNWYFNFLGIWSKSWQRSFLPTKDFYVYEDYATIKGYFVLDALLGFSLNRNLKVYLKLLNVFNKDYGGLNPTGYDIDLRYNPQLGSNARFGMTFILN